MRSKLSVALLAVSLVAAVATTAFAAQGWLGVTTQSTDSDLRRSLDLTRDGLLVNRVMADSPAERADLQRGDVILTYNSRSVTDPEDLRQLVRDTEPGKSVALAVWRDGARRTLNVKVGELPSDEESLFDVPTPRPAPAPEAPEPPTPPRAPRAPRAPESSREYSERHGDDGTVHRRMIVDGRELSEEEMKEHMKDMDKDGFRELKDLKELKDLPGMSGWSDSDGRSFGFSMLGRGRLGVRVEKLTGDLAQALGVDAGEGVLVVQVMEDTPAQKAGVRAGDVIVKVGDESVSDPDELVKALRSHDGKVDIVLLRKGARRTIQAELDRARTPRSFAFEPDGRRFNLRIPEPSKTPQVYRWRAKDQAENENLREELRQLRRELQELRREMGGEEVAEEAAYRAASPSARMSRRGESPGRRLGGASFHPTAPKGASMGRKGSDGAARRPHEKAEHRPVRSFVIGPAERFEVSRSRVTRERARGSAVTRAVHYTPRPMPFTPSYCPRCATAMAAADDHGMLRPACPACGYVWYRNPVPAAGVILVEQGRVLLVKRRWEPRAGSWCLPAGFMEAGEHPEQSAVRELQEETGVIAQLTGLFGVYAGFDDPRVRAVLILYRGVATGGEQRAGDDATELAWFPLDQLPEDLAFASHRQALTELRERLGGDAG